MKNTYRVLFVINNLYPYTNANSSIAYRIAELLAKRYSCIITIMGYDKEINAQYSDDPNWLTTIHMQGLTLRESQLYANMSRLERDKNYILHPLKHSYQYRELISRIKKQNSTVNEYRYNIEKTLKKEKYDVIIGFSNPTEIPKALADAKIATPFILYKLDPWGTHVTNRGNEEEKQLEYKADSKASAIITTEIIKDEYIASKSIFNEKVYGLGFPCIVKRINSPFKKRFDKSKTNCVYTGGLYKTVRNPDFMIKCFDMLKNDGIVLHIYGRLYEGLTIDYLPSNVFYHGEVPEAEAVEITSEADVLVNIGNTVKNQMPSKIFTYFSTGKPIVNIEKLVDSPSMDYMKRYPLAINVKETEAPSKELIDDIKRFILRSKGNHIPFEDVKERFLEYTPDYIGSEVYKIIRNVVQQ